LCDGCLRRYQGHIEKIDLIGDAAMFMAEGPCYASLLLDLAVQLHDVAGKVNRLDASAVVAGLALPP
jgi:hypothetical protein